MLLFLKMLLSFVFVFLFVFNVESKKENTLQLVHVIFRHGDRTKKAIESYPKDPHKNVTFFTAPYGPGELTNTGKLRQYRVGQALHDFYNEFLGNYYVPDIVEARTTDAYRSKASLMLVLASLFPPIGIQKFSPDLNWQPIPFEALPKQLDKELRGTACEKFKKIYEDYIKTPEFISEFQTNNETIKYLSDHTGLKIHDYRAICKLYLGMVADEEHGLQLPHWTKKVYPKKMEELATKYYASYTATTHMKQMAVGYFLQKIINDSMLMTQNKLPKNRKMYLYGTHESTFGLLLEVLHVLNCPQIPPYGSYLTIELHKVDDVYGFKMFYQDLKLRFSRNVKLPNCDNFCPLTRFEELMSENLPGESENDCAIINVV